MASEPLTHRRVAALALPLMLAQVATAASGVVDTGVMSWMGTKSELAAVSVASVALAFIYWAFGFLRMSTTGFVAQALGAEEELEGRAVLQRAIFLGAALGCLLVILSPLLSQVIFLPFGANSEVDALATEYFYGRIWGAPALLVGFAVTGWLLGTGQTRKLLALQVLMNGVNAGLDFYFVVELDWGPRGIGVGTAIAEWVHLIAALYVVRGERKIVKNLFDKEALFGLFSANRDILIRTLALLTGFAWFIRSGAEHGTAVLAGNEVLLQFVSVAGFVLDGFAFVAEKEVGNAVGARDAAILRRAIRVTTELALVSGMGIALCFFVAGRPIILAVVSDEEARKVAWQYLPYCAIIPLLGVPAWQLDGIFLGATHGKALRNAALATTLGYIGIDRAMSHAWGNRGVWSALLCMYVLRAVFLAIYLPSLPAQTSKRSKRADES